MEEEKEIKPIASMVECNHGGLELANVTDESLLWRRNWGDDAISKWEEAEVKYSTIDNDGEFIRDSFGNIESLPYFTIDNVDSEGKNWMYFLNMFLRYER